VDLKKIILIAVVLILLAFGGLYIWMQMLMSGVVAPDAVEYEPEYNFTVRETGFIDYGQNEPPSRMGYLVFDAYGENVTSMSASMSLYNETLPTEVYLLDYECVQCHAVNDEGKESIQVFSEELERQLKASGIIPGNSTLASKKVTQLELLQGKFILVVPTGKIPSPLVDPDSSVNINTLAARGCVIIYIGEELDQSLNRLGFVESVSRADLGALGISYSPGDVGDAPAPYTMKNGLYSVSSGAESTQAGAISKVRVQGTDGYFVVFPNSLELGWVGTGPESAAGDVAYMIVNSDWRKPFAVAEGSIDAEPRYHLPNTVKTIYATPSDYNYAFGRVFVTFTDPNKNEYTTYYDINMTNDVNGRLMNPASGVNNTVQILKIYFDEVFDQPRQFDVYLRTYQDLQKVDEQKLDPVKLYQDPYDVRMQYTINLAGGDHVLRIEDYTGNVYAQSYLHIPLVTFASTGRPLWEEGTFTFQLLEDGNPLPNTPVTITVDGLSKKTVTTGSNGIFTYEAGQSIGYGIHVFEAQSTGRTMSTKLERAREATFFDNPLNVGIILGAVLVFGIAIVIRRTEPVKYMIDIPDFPPARKELVKVSKLSFVSLLDAINNEYRWKHMPLTPNELKAGVRKKLTHQGKPILISDYNLDRLMNKLVEEGTVEKALGLYGLSAWEKQSGKSMGYLAAFRKIRNFFIQNAVMFTDLGKRSDCDILVNYRGATLFVHIYQGEDTLKKALLNAKKGRNFVVFNTRSELTDFEEKLEESASRLAVMLKMERDNRRVTFTHLGALGVIIGRAS